MKLYICFFTYGNPQAEVMDCLLREIGLAPTRGIGVLYDRAGNDALISRARSLALSRFYQETDADVCFMLDRDVGFEAGDLLDTASKAHERQACVAGLYRLRSPGDAVSTRMAASNFVVGEDRLHQAKYLATGFLAIPRPAVAKVLKMCGESTAPQARVTQFTHAFAGKTAWDFFRPVTVASEVFADSNEYLSEDWAFSLRCEYADVDRLIWSKPVLTHYGTVGFRVGSSTP